MSRTLWMIALMFFNQSVVANNDIAGNEIPWTQESMARAKAVFEMTGVYIFCTGDRSSKTAWNILNQFSVNIASGRQVDVVPSQSSTFNDDRLCAVIKIIRVEQLAAVDRSTVQITKYEQPRFFARLAGAVEYPEVQEFINDLKNKKVAVQCNGSRDAVDASRFASDSIATAVKDLELSASDFVVSHTNNVTYNSDTLCIRMVIPNK